MAFLFVALCVSMFVNLISLALLGTKTGSVFAHTNLIPPKEFDEEILVPSESSHDKVAVIPLEGVIAFGQEGSLGGSMVGF